MNDIRVIDAKKLKRARGERTLKEVADASGGKFSVQQLSAWEAGSYKPRPGLLPVLVAALGVAWVDISSEVVIDEVNSVTA